MPNQIATTSFMNRANPVSYSMLLLFFTALWTAISPYSGRPKQSTGDYSDLAVLVDHSVLAAGCGGPAIVDVTRGTVLFRSNPSTTVFSVDARNSLGEIIGSPGFGSHTMTLWSRTTDGDWGQWTERRIDLAGRWEAPTLAGISFTADETEIVMALSKNWRSVGRFALPIVDPMQETVTLGEPISAAGSASGLPVEIFPSADGAVAHLLGYRGVLSTVSTQSLMPVASPIRHAPAVPDLRLGTALARIGYTTTSQIVFGDISLDERFVVTNRWASPELVILDLQDRRSYTVRAGEGITMTGGVAFNRGWRNPGLLAVNALSQVIVYRFDGPDKLTELSRIRIDPIRHFGALEWKDRVPGNIIWDTSGERIIVPISNESNDFAILQVSNCGSNVTINAEVAVCEDNTNLGRAMWTANGEIGGTPETPCPQPSLFATATAPPTPVPTLTSVATPLPGNETLMEQEERVVGVTNGSDCGSLAMWRVWDGRVRRSGKVPYPVGRIASTFGLSSLIASPSDNSTVAYLVWENRLNAGLDRFGSWEARFIRVRDAQALPYGAISGLWGDMNFLVSYQYSDVGPNVVGIVDRLSAESVVSPISEVEVPRGVPSAFALQQYDGTTVLDRDSGTVWVVTDIGEVWRLDIEHMSQMKLTGPVASIGVRPPVDTRRLLPMAARIHAEIMPNGDRLLISGWGEPALYSVSLPEGTVFRHSLDDENAVGAIAVNYGWENQDLFAVHTGSHVRTMYFSSDMRSVETLAIQLLPSASTEGEDTPDSYPGSVAWSTNGMALLASDGLPAKLYVGYALEECGRELRKIYTVPACPVLNQNSQPALLLTNNQLHPPPTLYKPRCPSWPVGQPNDSEQKLFIPYTQTLQTSA